MDRNFDSSRGAGANGVGKDRQEPAAESSRPTNDRARELAPRPWPPSDDRDREGRAPPGRHPGDSFAGPGGAGARRDLEERYPRGPGYEPRGGQGYEPRGAPGYDPRGARVYGPEDERPGGPGYEPSPLRRYTAERDRFERYRDEMHARSIVSTYGNAPYDERQRAGQAMPWRGRDEEHDFWGQDRHPEEHHGGLPGLWERVKGVFTGRGPKNYVRPDDRIREDVCEHLSYHPYIDASDIEVIVRDGEVTLTGTVDARMVKRAAEECAEHVRGVKDIHNHLRVVPAAQPRPRVDR